jgi:hypothetical protein
VLGSGFQDVVKEGLYNVRVQNCFFLVRHAGDRRKLRL